MKVENRYGVFLYIWLEICLNSLLLLYKEVGSFACRLSIEFSQGKGRSLLELRDG